MCVCLLITFFEKTHKCVEQVQKVVSEKIRVFKRKRDELEEEVTRMYGNATDALLSIKTSQCVHRHVYLIGSFVGKRDL